MAKITRVLQKIFGLNAGAGERSEIGSLAEGTPLTTTDPLVMQSRAAFEGGWNDVVLGANSPAIEDRNSLDYVITRQIAYLMQQGIAEWDATTTYYINGLVIGSDGEIYQSLIDNSINFPPSVSSPLWKTVVYDLNIKADDSKSILSKMVGRSWSTAYDVEANSWNNVTWSPSLKIFCAVSSDGTNRVMTSPDGFAWTPRTAALAQFWTGIAWSESLSLFCAVSLDGGAQRVMTSPDGITWTARTDNSFNMLVDVIWVEDLSLFVAISTNGVDNVQTSSDGINWTLRTESSTANWNTLTWSSELNLLVAVGTGGGTAVSMHSEDGITWTDGADLPLAQAWNSVAWSPTLMIFVAVAGSGTNRVATSGDGEYWTSSAAIEDTNNTWNKVIWCPELRVFMALSKTSSGNSTQVMFSEDGLIWQGYIQPQNNGWVGLAWSPHLGRFAAVSQTGSVRGMATLPEGDNSDAVCLQDIQTSGTNGGGFTSGAWQTRVLNTILGSAGFVALAGNAFTIQPGRYIVIATSMAYKVNDHKLRLWNVTDGTDDGVGFSANSDSAHPSSTMTKLVTMVSISVPTNYRIEHRCSTTNGTDGFGKSTGFGVNELYSHVQINRLP